MADPQGDETSPPRKRIALAVSSTSPIYLQLPFVRTQTLQELPLDAMLLDAGYVLLFPP